MQLFQLEKKTKSRKIDCQFKLRARESFPLPKNYPLCKRSWYRHISIICYLKNMSRESMCVVHAKLLQSYWTLRPYGPIRFLCPQDSLARNWSGLSFPSSQLCSRLNLFPQRLREEKWLFFQVWGQVPNSLYQSLAPISFHNDRSDYKHIITSCSMKCEGRLSAGFWCRFLLS